MIGNTGQQRRKSGFTRLEKLFLLTIAMLVGAAGLFLYARSHGWVTAVAAEVPADDDAPPVFSSRVLTELAAENKRFADWARGIDTNTDWTLLDPLLDETQSPEFIAKSQKVVVPGLDPAARKALAANEAGSTGTEGALAGGSSGDGSAWTRRRKGDTSSVPQRVSSRFGSKAATEKGLADITKMLQDVAAMPWSPEAEQKMNLALARWAKLDPQGALNYAMSLDSRRARVNAVNNVIGAWARNDPAGAQMWFLQNMPQDRLAAEATMRQLYVGMAQANPTAALQNLFQLPTEAMQQSAMKIVMDHVVRTQGADEVANYFMTMQDPAQKNYLALSMAQTWAAYQPSVAADWLSKVTDPAMLKSAVPALVSTWGFDDPIAATQWAAQIQDPSLRYSSVARGTTMWAKEDPISAADWVTTLNPPSPQADPAIQGLVGVIMKSYPEGAMMWASAMNDVGARNNMMTQVGQVWLKQDPAAATEYILQSSLPNKTKQFLLGKNVKLPPKPATR